MVNSIWRVKFKTKLFLTRSCSCTQLESSNPILDLKVNPKIRVGFYQVFTQLGSLFTTLSEVVSIWLSVPSSPRHSRQTLPDLSSIGNIVILTTFNERWRQEGLGNPRLEGEGIPVQGLGEAFEWPVPIPDKQGTGWSRCFTHSVPAFENISHEMYRSMPLTKSVS